jgi:hypothetical protein
MQTLFVAMTLAASLQAPAATPPLGCGFTYVNDRLGYSYCSPSFGFQQRADGLCSWVGFGDPDAISEYAVQGPWVDPGEKSTVSCSKFYLLTVEIQTR